MWTHALGMSAPDLEDEPLSLDPRDNGTLIHDILDASLVELECRRKEPGESGGYAAPQAVAFVVAEKAILVGARWAAERAVPPAMLWSIILKRAETTALNALLYPLTELPGRASYSEVPFGSSIKPKGTRELPWDPSQPVLVPGTGLHITGRIDRVDVAADCSTARVIDYKTGKRPNDYILRGGRELQRCLYAYAVEALLGGSPAIEAGLLYPSRTSGVPRDGGAYDTLPDPRASLDQLTAVLVVAADNLRRGLALPGIAAGARYTDSKPSKDVSLGERDDLSFALPVVPGTMLGPKKEAARGHLGSTIADFWDAH